MENLNLNVSALNEEEITSLLLEAVKLANNKCINYALNISQLEEQYKTSELNYSKMLIEKDNLIGQLQHRVEEVESSLELQAKNFTEIQEKQSEIDAKNETTVAELTKQISENDKVINQKEQEISDLNKRNTQYKVELIKSLISHEIQYIKGTISTIDINESKELVTFLSNLVNSSDCLYREYMDIDELCVDLFAPEGTMSKIVTLIWWLNNDDTRAELFEMLNNDMHLKVSLEQVVFVFSLFGYKIAVPSTSFGDKIAGYGLYENSKSCIKRIFPDIEIKSPSLCEIYKISYNDNKGLCFYV